MSLWKYVVVKDLVILVLSKLHAEAIANEVKRNSLQFRLPTELGKGQPGWDYQRLSARWIIQALEKTCVSSPLTDCMWWCFRGRTLSNHLQRQQGKWGGVKSVWEGMSKMPMLCCSGRGYRPSQGTWSSSLVLSHSLIQSAVFPQEERELGYCKCLLLWYLWFSSFILPYFILSG